MGLLTLMLCLTTTVNGSCIAKLPKETPALYLYPDSEQQSLSWTLNRGSEDANKLFIDAPFQTGISLDFAQDIEAQNSSNFAKNCDTKVVVESLFDESKMAEIDINPILTRQDGDALIDPPLIKIISQDAN